MSRKRLTNETLESVSRVASAREYARLAESILGPAATDREVLETAQRLSSMSLDQVRGINNRRQAIQKQTKRLGSIDGVVAGGVDGAEDPWGEAGPEQPDPTNNQAYTKEIWMTPDHAVLNSLQKRDIHTPTASRMSRQSRQKWGAKENDEDDEDEQDESDVKAGEGGPVDNEHELGDEEKSEEFEGDDDMDLELDEEAPDVEGEFDDHPEDLLPEEEDDEDEHFDDMEGDEEDMGMDDEGDEFDGLMGLDEGDMEDEDHDEDFEDESEDMEGLGEDEEYEGEDMEGLGEDEEHEGAEMEGLGEEAEERSLPMPPKGSRQNRASGRRQASGKNSQGKKTKVAGTGASKVSLDDILNLHDEDVAREASAPLEGDDLDSLLGRKVSRAGNRVQTPVRATGDALESHRAMFERVWDNENDDAGTPRRRQASRRKPAPPQQQRKSAPPQRRKIARSTQDFTEDEQSFARTQFSPDRRRVASRPSDNEFDQVFKVPDVSRFFD